MCIYKSPWLLMPHIDNSHRILHTYLCERMRTILCICMLFLNVDRKRLKTTSTICTTNVATLGRTSFSVVYES